MTEVERISLDLERGKAARHAGLPARAASTYPESHWLFAWFLDGWMAVGRDSERDRLKNLLDNGPRRA